MFSLSLRRFIPIIRANFQTRCANFQTKGQEVVPDYEKINKNLCAEVISKVNNQITNKTHGRLFAIVQVLGQQYKITTEDILVIKHRWPPTIGDEIRLEKVLLVGSSDFTLIGRPILPLDQVSIYATVIEKTLSSTKTALFYRKRKNYTRCIYSKEDLTFLRITDINLHGNVNELGDTDGFKDRVF